MRLSRAARRAFAQGPARTRVRTLTSSPTRTLPSAAPRVGVALHAFDTPVASLARWVRAPAAYGGPVPRVLLVVRAKQPSQGCWSAPGGSLEFGERLADCAVREALEETNVEVRVVNPTQPVAVVTEAIVSPFHFVLLHLVGVAADPGAVPRAADDAADARWVPVPDALDLPPETAVPRFGSTLRAVLAHVEQLDRQSAEPSVGNADARQR